MHRWLCTTAPLLIGSIAVGAVHAAPPSGDCPGKHLARPPQAGQQDMHEMAGARALAAEASIDPLRACTGCHDGTVARAEVDMRADMFAGGRNGLTPARFDARP